MCQCTGFTGIRRSYCRISDRREGVVLDKFDEGMVDARAFTGSNRLGMYSAKGSMSDLACKHQVRTEGRIAIPEAGWAVPATASKTPGLLGFLSGKYQTQESCLSNQARHFLQNAIPDGLVERSDCWYEPQTRFERSCITQTGMD